MNNQNLFQSAENLEAQLTKLSALLESLETAQPQMDNATTANALWLASDLVRDCIAAKNEILKTIRKA